MIHDMLCLVKRENDVFCMYFYRKGQGIMRACLYIARSMRYNDSEAGDGTHYKKQR